MRRWLGLTPFDGMAARQDQAAQADIVEWILRARDGDSQAFSRLVERYERMVLRTALRLLGRMDDAQDAAQNTFLRMHRFLRGFDEQRDLGPWLYRVVVNASHDIARQRSRRLTSLTEMREAPDPTTRFGAEEIERAILKRERQQLVRRALATLPRKERAALVLRDIEGLPTAMVARILGSSESTVRSQLSAARLKLRRFVQHQEEEHHVL